jgi:hypothetical protein
MAAYEDSSKRVSPYHGESDDHSRLSDAMTSTKSGGSGETEEDLVYLEKINNAKQDARSEIKLHEWAKYNFCKLDLEKVLGTAPDNIEYIHCDDCSLDQMIERFEVPCKPVVIRGLMDRSPFQTTSLAVVFHLLANSGRWGAMKKWRTGYFLVCPLPALGDVAQCAHLGSETESMYGELSGVISSATH